MRRQTMCGEKEGDKLCMQIMKLDNKNMATGNKHQMW